MHREVMSVIEPGLEPYFLSLDPTIRAARCAILTALIRLLFFIQAC